MCVVLGGKASPEDSWGRIAEEEISQTKTGLGELERLKEDICGGRAFNSALLYCKQAT